MDILSRDLHSEDGVVSAAIGEAADRLEEISNENEKLKIELEEAKNYANELVDHKNMICLPADLANLRKANAHFAMENHKLQESQYTIEEIADYIAGWSMGSYESVRKIGKAVLLNALSQLQCDQDGIAAVRKRKRNL